MNVICFGDSNTYGYDPRGYFGGRYDADSRWVDILAAESGWTVYNMGQNGREIPAAAPTFPADTDLLIVMLGTNDLLQGQSPEQAAERLERFLSGISLNQNKILLIAPPPVALGAWVPSQQLIDDSHTFARCCKVLTEHLGVRFADAGRWDIPLAYDGVHFTEQGHRAFAIYTGKALAPLPFVDGLRLLKSEIVLEISDCQAAILPEPADIRPGSHGIDDRKLNHGHMDRLHSPG